MGRGERQVYRGNKPPKSVEQQPENQEVIELLKKVAATSEGIILTAFDLTNGVSIQIGQEVVASEYPNRCEYAKWDDALKKCISQGLIEQKGKDVYAITNAGYKML